MTRWMPPRRAVLVAPAVLVLVCGISSCGSDARTGSDDGSTTTTSADRNYLFGNLAAQREAGNVRIVARDLTEYLPNQSFAVDGAAPEPASLSVVRGRITEVVGARGFYVPGEGPEADGSSGTEIDFNDQRAQWRVYDVTVEVDDFVGASVPRVVHLGIPLDGPDTESLIDGLKSLENVVVVLDGQGFFTFDRELFYVDGFNTLLGRVMNGGAIRFPALENDGKEFMGELTTWAAVRAEFDKKKSVIAVDALGGRAGESMSR